MIQVIMGLKGSGKTKRLINSINEAVASAQGDVVCIEYGSQLTYDVNYRVRLVNSKEYEIDNVEQANYLLIETMELARMSWYFYLFLLENFK